MAIMPYSKRNEGCIKRMSAVYIYLYNGDTQTRERLTSDRLNRTGDRYISPLIKNYMQIKPKIDKRGWELDDILTN